MLRNERECRWAKWDEHPSPSSCWNHSFRSSVLLKFYTYIFILSHTRVLKATILDFCIASHRSAEDGHPTPLVVEQAYCVLSAVLSAAGQWAATPHALHPLPSAAQCLLHHSPFPQTPSHQLPGILSLCLGTLPFISLDLLLYPGLHLYKNAASSNLSDFYSW